MRVLCVLLAVGLCGCASKATVEEKIAEKKLVAIEPEASTELKKYPMHGQVKRLDPANKIVTIQHQPIGDWMGAMTMEFPVKAEGDFAKLKEEQAVEATVYVQGLNYWVGDVK
jgi:Cu/Ag efflux protein CusF